MIIEGIFTEEQCKIIKENYINKTLYNFLGKDYILINGEGEKIIKYESISKDTPKYYLKMEFELIKEKSLNE